MIRNDLSNGGYDLNTLVGLYQETKGDGYFEALWNEVKAFAITKIRRYPSIEREDAISIAMECLWEAVNKIKKGKNILTFYGRILDNRLYDTYFKKMQSLKYKMNAEAYSLESMKEDINYEPSVTEMPFDINMFNNECHLVDKEVLMVNMIYEGYKQREIAKQLKLDMATYELLLKNIREKIENNYLRNSIKI